MNKEKALTPQESYDITIVGGGMVGVSLALLLASENPNWRIALIEAFPFPQASGNDDTVKQALLYQPSFDARSTALSLGSIQILERLGLWQALSSHHTPINTVHVSDRGHMGGSKITAEGESAPMLGAVLENAWLGRVLLSQLQARGGVDILAPAELGNVQPRQAGAALTILDSDKKPQTFMSRLVVIADGGDTKISKKLGLEYQVQDYDQIALIANVEFEQCHKGRAFERFTDQGPMALLPLGESNESCRSALIWTLAREQEEEYLSLSEDEFLHRLQDRFGHRLGHFKRASDRHCYPLKLKISREQIRSSMVVMGNAAHYLHPVAGQGFNLALRDCAALTEVLSAAARKGEALGKLATLERYMKRQQLDQDLTVGFSDGIVKLFSSSNPFKQLARNIGFLGLAIVPEAKKYLSQQTMGLASRRARVKPSSGGQV